MRSRGSHSHRSRLIAQNLTKKYRPAQLKYRLFRNLFSEIIAPVSPSLAH